MEQIKINIKDLGGDGNFIKIPLGNSFTTVDNSETFENEFIPDEIENAITPTQNFEKSRFSHVDDIEEIIINLMSTGSTETFYDSLGFTNDDIKFRRNRFKNSFLKLNFYDSPNPTKRKLVFQQILYSQLNEDQRDIDGQPLDVSIMPVTFRLVKSTSLIFNRNKTSEGFYLYWLSNPTEAYPTNFYMQATYNNALDGIVTPLIAFDSILSIQQYNNLNYVEYKLFKQGGMSEYQINQNNRTINQVPNTIIISLYPTKIL